MEISKATGVNTIPPKVIRTAAPYISNVVAKLFNTSFTCSRFLSGKSGNYNDHCLTLSKYVANIQSRVYPKPKLLNRI